MPTVFFKPVLVIAVAVAVFSTQAAAMTSMGNRSCGNWVEERKNDSSWPAIATKAWLVGYLSGMAVASGKDILKTIDASSILLWMDNYCKANPLKRIGEGGIELSFELEKKEGYR